MAKSLSTSLCATHERLQKAILHPRVHFDEIDAASADLGVNVEIHVQRRVPPPAQTHHQERGVVELWTGPRFEMVDEARVGAHRKLASPAGDPSRSMFRHVLRVLSAALQNSMLQNDRMLS